MSGLTLYDKLWQTHVVEDYGDGTVLLYIDHHFIHEVTSPQAFEGIKLASRSVLQPTAAFATPDHNVPTKTEERQGGVESIADPLSKQQVRILAENCQEWQIPHIPMLDERQGIVHVVGPEQGLTQPGMTVVCGDSHTSTHGALAALAHGIGTSEVEHVLATQCLRQKKMRNMRVLVSGQLQPGVTAKDIVLYLIGQIGTAGGTGYAIEFMGEAISSLSVEGRMTICNMAIEAGARAGLVAVDDITVEYLRGRPGAPTGAVLRQAETFWRTMVSDIDANFDREEILDASLIEPQVTWGTSPEMVSPISGRIPYLSEAPSESVAKGWQRAFEYMSLPEGLPITQIPLQRVFIGSCTNGRIEDLREAARIVRGKKISSSIREALVVPGSGLVKAQAEAEGLDEIFLEAGFEWRQPGCSMCLAMNSDRLQKGEHCASTSNRNFEGRQGFGGCTHLVSPSMAAAAAIEGFFVDVRKVEVN